LIITEAPARICFFGDHQDYLKLPVIAGTIDRKITVKAIPNLDAIYFIQLIDLNKVITINLNEKFNYIQAADYYRSSLAVLQKEGAVFEPGGLMDQYTIAQGGLIYIDTQDGNTTPLTPQLGQLLVAESGISKQTLSVLQNAREYGQNAIQAVKKHDPKFNIQQAQVADYERYIDAVPGLYQNHWYAAIHNYDLTLKAKKALSAPSVDRVQLGKWMNEHQQILEERIQNTPDAMKLQMEAARKAGALGTKIIGSGGGGCMVAMVTEDTKQKVIDAFLSQGAVAAYEVQLTSL
jgi:galactokinase